jgi:Fe-S cluster assembly protein SufD
MELTTLSNQLQEAWGKHRATLSGHYSWEKIQQDAYTLLEKGRYLITKSEDYKYTPTTRILSDKFNWSHLPSQGSGNPLITADYISAFLPAITDSYAIVLVNGALHEVTYALNENLPFEVMSFAQAYPTYQQLVDSYFAHYLTTTRDPFALINTALFDQGILLHIPDNTVLKKPLCIYNLTNNVTTSSNINYPRVLISIGNKSQVSLINSWNSLPNQSTFTNAVIDIQVGSHAQLDYYTLQIQGKKAYQVINTNFYQAEHSQVNSYTFTWEGELIRNNLSFHLQAPYAQSNMYGLYDLNGSQHVDNQTTVEHQQPYTNSQELYKGIVTDEATGIFNGKIYVRAEAQKTNAFQTNNNILLADTATIHTKPQLEIWADDVKCSHGATVGQLDENQLFYLRARGIPEKEAKHMLLYAFGDEVIEKIPIVSLRDYLKEKLDARLGQMT